MASGPGAGDGGATGAREAEAAVERLGRELAAAAPGEARAAAASRLLEAAGLLLRRGSAAADAALIALDAADVEGWLERADGTTAGAALEQAAEAAIEACLAEGAEADGLRRMALDSLELRDRFESALAAARRWREPGPAGGAGDAAAPGAGGGEAASAPPRAKPPAALARIAAGLAASDRRAAAIARALVGLNRQRRAARDRLAPGHRARAFWYSARAECDGLAALWSGAPLPQAAAAHCPACARDLQAAPHAAGPAARCATAEELWALEDGALDAASTARIRAHARRCPECSLALEALWGPPGLEGR